MEAVRERLLDAAEALVYRNGIHATGTKAILDAADTARMSLYNHFGSKEGLVVAALERRDERWMRWFEEETGKHKPGRERVLGMFEVLDSWFKSPDFHGCAFINVSGEIYDADDPARVVARRHKARLRAFIEKTCAEAGLSRPAMLARQIFLLVDGAIVTALVEPGCSAATDARKVAETLMQDQNLSEERADPDRLSLGD